MNTMFTFAKQLMGSTATGRRLAAAWTTRQQAVRGAGSNIGPLGWAVIATTGVLAFLGVMHYVIIPWAQGIGTNVSGISTTTTGTQP